MSIRFFPSATLARYAAGLLFTRVLAFAFGLVLILQTLDLLTESNDILAVPGNGYAQLGHYVLLRLPQLVSQFLPFCVLLATLAAFASLNQNSEIIVMKASGLSAHQILRPFLLTAFGVALCHFAFNELVTTRTSARLQSWTATDYGAKPLDAPGKPVWVVDGAQIVRAQSAEQRGSLIILRHFEAFQRRNQQTLAQIIQADQAVYNGQSWTLTKVTRFSPLTGILETKARMPWQTHIQASRFLAGTIVPDQVNILALGRAIESLKSIGQPTDALRAAFYHKLLSPLSSALMPLLGAVAAFGIARSGQLFARVVIGMALGFAYFVVDNFMMAMAQFGSTPALMAAGVPVLLFYCLGQTLLYRTEE